MTSSPPYSLFESYSYRFLSLFLLFNQQQHNAAFVLFFCPFTVYQWNMAILGKRDSHVSVVLKYTVFFCNFIFWVSSEKKNFKCFFFYRSLTFFLLFQNLNPTLFFFLDSFIFPCLLFRPSPPFLFFCKHSFFLTNRLFYFHVTVKSLFLKLFLTNMLNSTYVMRIG